MSESVEVSRGLTYNEQLEYYQEYKLWCYMLGIKRGHIDKRQESGKFKIHKQTEIIGSSFG